MGGVSAKALPVKIDPKNDRFSSQMANMRKAVFFLHIRKKDA